MSQRAREELTRTCFVGDIHGCAAELAALVEKMEPTRLILLGDLFSKGPDPRGVWDVIQQTGAESVLGNHDAYQLQHWDRLATEGVMPPETARAWLASRPLQISGKGSTGDADETDWMVVHGGIDPLRGFSATPHWAVLNMRKWKDGRAYSAERAAAPFWWEQYSGPPTVIYGHDARRGLVDRRPHSIGLDTGCVYGGQLTGLIWETGEVMQIPAARAYLDVGRART